ATNLGLDLSVVAWTKSTMAFFAAPSFHEGRGSVCAIARVPATSSGMQIAKVTKRLLMEPIPRLVRLGKVHDALHHSPSRPCGRRSGCTGRRRGTCMLRSHFGKRNWTGTLTGGAPLGQTPHFAAFDPDDMTLGRLTSRSRARRR